MVNKPNATGSHLENMDRLLKKEIAAHLKTKELLSLREGFLAIVSHDLKNPLGAISSCAEMVLKGITNEKLGPETKDWVRLIKRNADTSLRMINDILDMERITNDKLEIHTAKNHLASIIKDVIDSFFHMASTKKIEIQFNPDEKCGHIFCDRDRILQVLSNLMCNAVKFTPDRGTILIKTVAKDNEVMVSVCDTGPGIPPEKMNTIFERYEQLKSKNRSGLGLGLYISKTLIEAHGGKIWVESKVGEGTQLNFTIPISNRF